MDEYIEMCADAVGDRLWALYNSPGSTWPEHFDAEQFRLVLNVSRLFAVELLENYTKGVYPPPASPER